jgi:hypothetical protein
MVTRGFAMLSAAQRQQLIDQGFLIFPGLIAPAEVARLNARVEELFLAEGENAGSEFKTEPGARRIANAVDKGEVFEEAIDHPLVLAAVEVVLGADFKLSSLNVRSANPHNGCAQPLHVDGGELPDAIGNSVCNSVWMLDDFTEVNGALRIVPGSHRWGAGPDGRCGPDGQRSRSGIAAASWEQREAGSLSYFRRQSGPDEQDEPDVQEMLVTGRAGDVVVMNAHLWHGGSENFTDGQRRAMHVYYTRGDKPQQQYQKRLVRSEVQARLSPLRRRILALDDPRNDVLSAAGSGRSGFLR